MLFFCFEDAAAHELHVQISLLRPAFCLLFNGLGRLPGNHVSEPVQTPLYPLVTIQRSSARYGRFVTANVRKRHGAFAGSGEKGRREKSHREFATRPSRPFVASGASHARCVLWTGDVPETKRSAGRKLSCDDAPTRLAPQRCPNRGAFRVSCLNRLNRRPVIGAVGKMLSPSHTRCLIAYCHPFGSCFGLLQPYLRNSRVFPAAEDALRMGVDDIAQNDYGRPPPLNADLLEPGSGHLGLGDAVCGDNISRVNMCPLRFTHSRASKPPNSSRVGNHPPRCGFNVSLPRSLKCRTTRFSKLPV